MPPTEFLSKNSFALLEGNEEYEASDIHAEQTEEQLTRAERRDHSGPDLLEMVAMPIDEGGTPLLLLMNSQKRLQLCNVSMRGLGKLINLKPFVPRPPVKRCSQ